jgi:hypothetical protein
MKLMTDRSHALEKITYNSNVALEICERIAAGEKYEDVQRAMGLPKNSITRWAIKYPSFGEALLMARRLSAPVFEDKALSIADNLSDIEHVTPQVVSARGHAMNQYRWSAERRNPETYQRKPDQTSGVTVIINTPLDIGQGSQGGGHPGQSIYEFAAQFADNEPEDAEVVSEPETLIGASGIEVPLHPKPNTLRPPDRRFKENRRHPKYKSEAKTKMTATKAAQRRARAATNGDEPD